MRVFALAVRFLVELAMFAACAVAAWAVGGSALGGVWRWVLVVALPLLVIVAWGLLLSPRARIPLPPPARVPLEAALFVGAAIGLAFAGWWIAGVVLVAVWLLDRVALTFLPRADLERGAAG